MRQSKLLPFDIPVSFIESIYVMYNKIKNEVIIYLITPNKMQIVF